MKSRDLRLTAVAGFPTHSSPPLPNDERQSRNELAKIPPSSIRGLPMNKHVGWRGSLRRNTSATRSTPTGLNCRLISLNESASFILEAAECSHPTSCRQSSAQPRSRWILYLRQPLCPRDRHLCPLPCPPRPDVLP